MTQDQLYLWISRNNRCIKLGLTLFLAMLVLGCSKSTDLNLSCSVTKDPSGEEETRTYQIRDSSWAGTKCTVTGERITCAASTGKDSNFLELDRTSGTINHSFSANGEDGEYKGTCEKVEKSKF
jgi:hypothetical protein